MIRLAVGFALLPLLLHGVGNAKTGLFLFATTITGYFTAVDVSIGSSVTRYVAEHRARDEMPQLIATVRGSLLVMVGFGTLIAVILAVVAIAASPALFGEASVRSSAQPTLLVAAGVSALYWPSRLGVAALNGIERYDQSAFIQIASSLIVLCSIGWLAHEHAQVAILVAVFGVLSVLEGLIAAGLAWRPLGVDRRWLARRGWRGHHLRSVLRFGAAAFVIGMSDTVINSFDRAIVGAVVGASAIVSYDIAYRPQNAVKTFSGLAGLALVSPVARLAAVGQSDRMRELVLVASLLSIAITAPIAVIVMVLAHPFVDAWLGSAYGRYSPYVVIFVSYWTVNCATAALSAALYGIGRLREYARLMVLLAAMSLPLSIALTLWLGTVGVIWGTVIPSVLILPLFALRALRLLEIEVRRFVFSVLLPAAGTMLVWSAVVVAADLALEPGGYPAVICFAAVALTLAWAAFAPMLLKRMQAALTIPATA